MAIKNVVVFYFFDLRFNFRYFIDNFYFFCDNLMNNFAHLHARGTSFVMVARAQVPRSSSRRRSDRRVSERSARIDRRRRHCQERRR